MESAALMESTPTKLAGKISPKTSANVAKADDAKDAKASPATGPATKPAEIDLANVAFAGAQISFTFKSDSIGSVGVAQASAAVFDETLTGRIVLPSGRVVPLHAKRSAPATKEPQSKRVL